MLINSLHTLSNTPISISAPILLTPTLYPSLFPIATQIRLHHHGRSSSSKGVSTIFKGEYEMTRRRGVERGGGGRILCGLLPVGPDVDPHGHGVTNLLFALSLFPYLGFLYFLSRVKSAPKLTLFGFYFLLVFVGATIPVGIYEKVKYGASLSNVDWLHGGAESLLALSNLFVVLGLREALRKSED